MTQSTWSEIPAARPSASSRRWRALVVRAVVALAAAAVLWWLGLEIPAVLVVVAVAVLSALDVVRPAAAARVEQLVTRFGVLVGRAIALVFLTLVNLLVFTPAAFVMWLCRYDPLAPGVRRQDPSFWHAHSGRPLPNRQFSDERSLWAPVGAVAPRRRPILRVATVVGVVALVLAADLGGGWLYEQVSDKLHGSAAVADDSFEPSAQPAFHDSPWAAEVLAEQSNLPGVRDSFLGYRLGDSASAYTNISDGERLTYRPGGSGRRVSVWFFGGSALFGDGQRDGHTIPSEFARIAESHGILVDARNFGRPATTMWEELELFQQQVASGVKPDLVVFYDGFNDLAGQLNQGLTTEPTNYFDPTAGDAFGTAATATPRKAVAPDPASGEVSGIEGVVDAYWDQSASHKVYDALDELFGGGSDAPAVRFAAGAKQRDTSAAPVPDESKQAAENAIALQAKAAKVASTLAAGMGAQAHFFWQPSVFTKRLLPEEQAYLKLGNYEPARWDPTVRLARRLLQRTPYVDLGGALDSAPEPVLWDFVHTNELGAELAARAIFDHLEPALRDARAKA